MHGNNTYKHQVVSGEGRGWVGRGGCPQGTLGPFRDLLPKLGGGTEWLVFALFSCLMYLTIFKRWPYSGHTGTFSVDFEMRNFP